MARRELSEAALAPADRLAPVDLAVGLLTYNNAETVDGVLEAVTAGIARFPDTRAALVVSDAGSSDDTRERLTSVALPSVVVEHEVQASERISVAFHGVPGRGAALRAAFTVAHRLRARALVLVEADAVSITPDWIERLAGPLLQDKADFALAAYSRHRYEGTITRLVLAPLVRALYGRRLHYPFGGQQGLSARLLEHLLRHPKWAWTGADISDLWITGTAIADGFGLVEAWLGPHQVRSVTRAVDLPSMIAQTVGAAFTVMERHGDLWLEVRGSEPITTVGEPAPPGVAPMTVDVERMVEAFRQGARDLTSIWELVLAPDTLAEVLAVVDDDRLRLSDDLWARVVYDFALGHHYSVVHRDHLLRSLTPLYLGRTAAFVLATRSADSAATQSQLEAVAAAFERQKTYLVEHWR
jgi:glucosylglycerate synthase